LSKEEYVHYLCVECTDWNAFAHLEAFVLLNDKCCNCGIELYVYFICASVCQEQNNEEMYHGSPADHNVLLQWVNEKCVPLVRELTFENAEVLVSDVLLFLIILFSRIPSCLPLNSFDTGSSVTPCCHDHCLLLVMCAYISSHLSV